MTSHDSLLTEFQRSLLTQAMQRETNPTYLQRIEIMLMADDGYSQSQICRKLGCAQVTARHWIMMAKNGKAHLWHEPPLGRPKEVDQAFRDRLKALVTSHPRNYGYPAKRWSGRSLGQQLAKELGVQVSDRYINALLKQMGLSTRQPKTTPSSPQTYPVLASRSIAITDLNPESTSESTPALNLPNPLRPKFDPSSELN